MSKLNQKNRTSLLKKFENLLEIMDTLREKCPWDKVQTLQSLRELTLEESYELSDAIIEKNVTSIIEELGDLLLHIIFYAKILEETTHQGIGTIMECIGEKLIRRHPHIYGKEQAKTVDEVSKNWEKIKQGKEGKESILSGVPKSAPALNKSIIVQKKAAGIGFDFESEKEAWEKVCEEIEELKKEKDQKKREDELGDVLFSLINWARKTAIDPDYALRKTVDKFVKRFQFIEHKSFDKGKRLTDLSKDEMEYLWEKSKNSE